MVRSFCHGFPHYEKEAQTLPSICNYINAGGVPTFKTP